MTRKEELALQEEFIRKHGVKECESTPNEHQKKISPYEDGKLYLAGLRAKKESRS